MPVIAVIAEVQRLTREIIMIVVDRSMLGLGG
jgi:hypothetical protein